MQSTNKMERVVRRKEVMLLNIVVTGRKNEIYLGVVGEMIN